MQAAKIRRGTGPNFPTGARKKLPARIRKISTARLNTTTFRAEKRVQRNWQKTLVNSQCRLILCDQDKTAGIHVDPVAELGFLELCIIPDLVDQGVVDIAFAGMDRNSLEFVDDEKPFCLSDDLIHFLLSLGRSLFRIVEKFIRKPDLYYVSGLYGNVFVDLPAVDPYVAPLKRVKQIGRLKARERLQGSLYDMKSVLGLVYCKITHL